MNYKLSQINISLVLVFTYLMVNLNYNKFWVIRVKFHVRGNHEDINWDQTHAGLAIHAPITIICQIMQLYAKLNFANIIISVNVYRMLSMLFLHRKCFSATNSLHTTILDHQNCFCPNQTKTKSVLCLFFQLCCVPDSTYHSGHHHCHCVLCDSVQLCIWTGCILSYGIILE